MIRHRSHIIIIVVLNAVSLPVKHLWIANEGGEMFLWILISFPSNWLEKLLVSFEFIDPSVFPVFA